jgi:hypothetical protein
METGSKPFSLNAVDWRKIWTGTKVALAGALLTVAIPEFTDFSYLLYVNGRVIDLTVPVMALLSVVANIVRKFISDNSRQ